MPISIESGLRWSASAWILFAGLIPEIQLISAGRIVSTPTRRADWIRFAPLRKKRGGTSRPVAAQ
jgi:hypothetical protein